MRRNCIDSIRPWHFLVVILVLAALLRLVALESSPPSLYWEEVALGYDAFSILQTGKDHHGTSFPLVAFESFGDWKPGLYFYLVSAMIPFFQLSMLSVRLPSALAGIATVFLVYLLVRRLGFKESVALSAALVLAILPWHLQFSRAGFEVTMATMLLTLGIYLLARAKDNIYWIYTGIVSLVLSMYTYHGLRVLAPLMGLLMTGVYWKYWIKNVNFWLSAVLAIVLLTPLLTSINSPQVQQRFTETSLLSVSEGVEKTNLWREQDGNTTWSRLIHHRYWYWGKEILSGAVSHYDIDFLFLSGDGNARHQTGYFALLYHWMILPLFYGLYKLVQLKRREVIIVLGWLILATLPAAITKTTPHTLRFLPASPAFAIVIGFGMVKIYQWLRKFKYGKLLGAILVCLIAAQWIAYTFDYFLVYPKRSSADWQYGYQEIMLTVDDLGSKYDHIYITRDLGRPAMYYFFHNQIDPDFVQQVEPHTNQDQGEFLEFGKIKFGEFDGAPNSMVVSSEPIENLKKIKEIKYLDAKPAAYVYEI